LWFPTVAWTDPLFFSNLFSSHCFLPFAPATRYDVVVPFPVKPPFPVETFFSVLGPVHVFSFYPERLGIITCLDCERQRRPSFFLFFFPFRRRSSHRLRKMTPKARPAQCPLLPFPFSLELAAFSCLSHNQALDLLFPSSGVGKVRPWNESPLVLACSAKPLYSMPFFSTGSSCCQDDVIFFVVWRRGTPRYTFPD